MNEAKELMFLHHENFIPVSKLFLNKNQKVLDEALMIAAEWRDVEDMRELVKLGANPHYVEDQGFSVLERTLEGHDGYWRTKAYVETAEDAVVFLELKGVTKEEIRHNWIISNCSELIEGSLYLQSFFGLKARDSI